MFGSIPESEIPEIDKVNPRFTLIGPLLYYYRKKNSHNNNISELALIIFLMSSKDIVKIIKTLENSLAGLIFLLIF